MKLGEGKTFRKVPLSSPFLRVVDSRRGRRRDRHSGGLHQLLVEGPPLGAGGARGGVDGLPGARLGTRGLGSGPLVDADARERVGAEADAAVAAADAGAGRDLGPEPVRRALLAQGEARVVAPGRGARAHRHGPPRVAEQRRRARRGARGPERRPLQALDLAGGVEAGAGVVGGLDGRGAVDDGARGAAGALAAPPEELEARGARAVLAERRAERRPAGRGRPELAEGQGREPLPGEGGAGSVAGDSRGRVVEVGAEAVGGGGGEGGLCEFFFFFLKFFRVELSVDFFPPLFSKSTR